MLRLPSEREQVLYKRLRPWFAFSEDVLKIKENAPNEIKKDFKEWLELTSDLIIDDTSKFTQNEE